jgi:hypothetical protein
VRRPAGVGYWLDGAKTVASIGCRLETTVALEIGIPRYAPVVEPVYITSVRVALPDLHECGFHRPAIGIQHPASQIRYLAGREAVSPFYRYQIIVVVKRDSIRIKRASRLSWCQRCRGSCRSG